MSTHLVLAATVCAILLYRLWIITHNLCFSPLAKFPGPKIAAASYLPELYYNLFAGEGGQFPFAIRRWHDKYGPIVRVNPHELHIRDASYFDTVYTNSRPAWKIKDIGRKFRNELAACGTEDPAIWKIRRAAINPFFSRRSIALQAPRFQQKIAKALQIVEKSYARAGEVLNLNSMWGCFAGDNLIDMCFDQDAKMLESHGFHAEINEAMEELFEGVHIFYHLPRLMPLMLKLPDKILIWLNPNVKPVLAFWNSLSVKLSQILEAPSLAETGNDRTVFSAILRQDLPAEERTHERLHQEALSIIGAGVHTAARALTVATFYILDQPRVRQRLMTELHEAIPDGSAVPEWNALVKLPYLSACVEEACRLTYGVVQRRPRAFDSSLEYRGWKIPPGTLVSMTSYDVLRDEVIFPDSEAFIPGRWLGEPLAPDGRPLKVYQVAFGKGTRSCVGMQLAYAELFLGLAHFFRSPMAARAELYETDHKDVEFARELFVPKPAKASRGVRIVFRPNGS